MTRYNRLTGKYMTTFALKDKLQLCRFSVTQAEQALKRMERQNQKRTQMYKTLLRRNRGNTHMVSIINKEIVVDRRRAALRLRPSRRSVILEKSKLRNVINRIRRSQNQGKIYRIL